MSIKDQNILRAVGLSIVDAAKYLAITRQTLARRVNDPAPMSFSYYIDLANAMLLAASKDNDEPSAEKLRATVRALRHTVITEHQFDISPTLIESLSIPEQYSGQQLKPPTGDFAESSGNLSLANEFDLSGWKVGVLFVASVSSIRRIRLVHQALLGEKSYDFSRWIVVSNDVELSRYLALLSQSRKEEFKCQSEVFCASTPATELLPDSILLLDPTRDQHASHCAWSLEDLALMTPATSRKMIDFADHVERSVTANSATSYKGIPVQLINHKDN